MDILLLGMTLGVVGKVLLGIAVLRVHMGIFKEHKIDGKVLDAIVRERYVTYFAILLIVLGYVCEVSAFGYAPAFFGIFVL